MKINLTLFLLILSFFAIGQNVDYYSFEAEYCKTNKISCITIHEFAPYCNVFLKMQEQYYNHEGLLVQLTSYLHVPGCEGHKIFIVVDSFFYDRHNDIVKISRSSEEDTTIEFASEVNYYIHDSLLMLSVDTTSGIGFEERLEYDDNFMLIKSTTYWSKCDSLNKKKEMEEKLRWSDSLKLKDIYRDKVYNPADPWQKEVVVYFDKCAMESYQRYMSDQPANNYVEYVYNSNSLLVTKKEYSLWSTGDGGHYNCDSTSYEYDLRGRLIKVTSYENDRLRGIELIKRKKDGTILEKEFRDSVDDASPIIYKYSYNKKKQLIGMTKSSRLFLLDIIKYDYTYYH